MNKCIAILLTLLCLTFFCVQEVNATTYYVAPTGNNTNTGTFENPFRNVQYAVNLLNPGDTLYLRGGTYNEKIIFPRSGAQNLPITVSGYSSEVAIIDGSGITVNSNDGLVKLFGRSYITISRLTIQNSGFIGVYASSLYNPFVSSHHLNISELRVLNSRDAAIKVVGISYIDITQNYTKASGSSGIGVWRSDHALIDHNEVVNARNLPLDQGGHEECISIAITHDFEVSNNEVYYEDGVTGYLGGAGIDVKESSYTGTVHHNYTHDIIYDGGIYLDAWEAGLMDTPTLHDVKVYNNKTLNAGGISIGSERGGIVENIDIYNNQIIRSSWSGIVMHSTGGDGLRKNINIYNNTIYQSTGNGGSGIYIVTSNIQNIVIRNNIVAFDPKWVGQITLADPSVLSQVTADHNITYGRKLCSIDYPNCYNFSDINSDPQFKDPQNYDLHLQPTSPAINAGLNLGITTDLDDNSRPQGAGFDLGAYEFSLNPNPSPSSHCLPLGDVDCSGKVNLIDVGLLIIDWGYSNARSDLNNNQMVDQSDMRLLLNNYGFGQ